MILYQVLWEYLLCVGEEIHLFLLQDSDGFSNLPPEFVPFIPRSGLTDPTVCAVLVSYCVENSSDTFIVTESHILTHEVIFAVMAKLVLDMTEK